MTTLYHTLFVDRMYSLEHNNMTAAPVIKGNTSVFLPTGASLSISKWRLREIGVLLASLILHARIAKITAQLLSVSYLIRQRLDYKDFCAD